MTSPIELTPSIGADDYNKLLANLSGQIPDFAKIYATGLSLQGTDATQHVDQMAQKAQSLGGTTAAAQSVVLPGTVGARTYVAQQAASGNAKYKDVKDVRDDFVFKTQNENGAAVELSGKTVKNALLNGCNSDNTKVATAFQAKAQKLGFKYNGDTKSLVYPSLDNSAPATAYLGKAAGDPANVQAFNYVAATRPESLGQDVAATAKSNTIWNVTAKYGGAILGGIGGFFVGGPIGAALGGAGGYALGSAVSGVHNQLSNADLMGKIANSTGNLGGVSAQGITGLSALSGISAASGVLGALGGGGFSSTSVQMQQFTGQSAAIAGDNAMLGMLSSHSMPIEDMIAYFMIYMEQNYENDLEAKMQEAVIEDEKERKQAQTNQMFNAAAGLLNTVTLGVGGNVLQMGKSAYDQVQNASDPNAKSSTMLTQEIQILTQKWQELVTLTSNLLKELSDMQMGVIKNIR